MRHLIPRLVFTAVFAAAGSLGCSDGELIGAGALVTGERGVTSIAVDDFHLYWAKADGTINAISLDGGQPTTLVSGQNLPDQIAVDGAQVYWANGDGTVMAAPKDGGPEILLAQDVEIHGLGVDATHVYWTGESDVRRVLKDGGTMEPEPVAAGLSKPGRLVARSGGVFCTSQGVDVNDGAVLEVALGGAAPREVAAGQSKPFSLAVDGDHICWASFGDGTVSCARLDGSEALQVAAEQEALNALAADPVAVYWTRFDGTVSMAPLVGGEPVEIAKGPSPAKVSLAIDLTSVYWANDKDGAILVMPKQ